MIVFALSGPCRQRDEKACLATGSFNATHRSPRRPRRLLAGPPYRGGARRSHAEADCSLYLMVEAAADSLL